MTSNASDVEKSNNPMKLSLCSLRTGKKYVLGLITTKAIIIWFIYTRSNDFWPVPSLTSIAKAKPANITLYNVSLFHIPLTSQTDMLPFYIEISPEVWCFINGLDIRESRAFKKCKCLKHWFGLDCGIPEPVWQSSYVQQGKSPGIELRRRKVPRRIICSVLMMNEYTSFELLVRNLINAVDVVLVTDEAENQTSLIEALRQGYLSDFQNKIMPISVGNANMTFRDIKTWSSFMFTHLWTKGWQHVSNFRPDDIFLLLHVSSIISKDVLIFLKLYDGFPEPFYFEMRPLLYQFHRSLVNNSFFSKFMVPPPLGCSFQYFHVICHNDIAKLFSNTCITDIDTRSAFEKNFWHLEPWIVGAPDIPSGWQCYWCTKISEIKQTLNRHRWLLHNLNLNESFLYPNSSISTFVNEGRWFDGSNLPTKQISRKDTYFAPINIISDPQKLSFLFGGASL